MTSEIAAQVRLLRELSVQLSHQADDLEATIGVSDGLPAGVQLTFESELLEVEFKRAWHAADDRGEVGGRTRAGIQAVLASLPRSAVSA